MKNNKIDEDLLELIIDGIFHYEIKKNTDFYRAIIKYFENFSDIDEMGIPNFAMKILQEIEPS